MSDAVPSNFAPCSARTDMDTLTPTDDVRSALINAGILLSYASEAGIALPADKIDAILALQADVEHGGTTRARLVAYHAAATDIAARLSPVTADTVRACGSQTAARSLARNRLSASILTAVIIALSILTFIDSSIVTKLSSDIAVANTLAIDLRSVIKQPSGATDGGGCGTIHSAAAHQEARSLDDLTMMQQFAAGLRDIYAKSIKLDYFVAGIEHDPLQPPSPSPPVDNRDRLQIDPGLVNFDAEVVCKINTYEEVRDFAQNILLDNTVAFGALAAYILPVAYAMLGAMAFRLRAFSDTIRKRTYHPSYADSARMMAALIAGTIVSLFNSFSAEVSLSPLALAFLAGYGVEIFFTFLDTILNSFGSGSQTAKPQAKY